MSTSADHCLAEGAAFAKSSVHAIRRITARIFNRRNGFQP